MIWKLSNKIWWGNCESVNEEVPACYLCVADNLHDISKEKHDPFRREAGRVPYFRLPWDENQDVDYMYVSNFKKILLFIDSNHWFPILIYCRAGQVRSPAAAVFSATYLEKINLEHCKKAAYRLRPDIDLEEKKRYPNSLLKSIESLGGTVNMT